MRPPWVSNPDPTDPSVTEAELRRLYDTAHNPEPELTEHLRFDRDQHADGTRHA
ncbi:hypothetical protein ABFT23_02255 [Nocardioides sp. C4-1]|uniref:hypothetical protein n=1 Tax=Nocardioides sp. C4-1 TaxID=3151851 RepID=UPI003262FEFC